MLSPSEDPTISSLEQGKLSLQGEFLWGSNYTYLVNIKNEQETLQGVYKPTRGVQPLWDFPPASLARHEVAAYILSEALGWKLVPPTVYRRDGPLGPGSLQLFIEHDPEYHYYNFTEADRQRLRPVVIFDLLINNADRKGSHILLDPAGHLWLIDHGICFHVEDKLRTVVWDFAGEPIPGALVSDLLTLLREINTSDELDAGVELTLLSSRLRSYLTAQEFKSLRERVESLIQTGSFPNQDPNRRQVPWPPV